jgi:hypothetical protein
MLGASRRVVLLMVVAGFVLVARPFAPAAQAQSAPHLATLFIDVWPEFDRPATVLVIYRGVFAPDVPLPPQVKLRIPASAGAPSAVAYPRPGTETASNPWADLLVYSNVSTTPNGDWTEVTFAPTSRLFNLEFYDKLNTVTFDRRYTVTWPGDYAADAVTINVREPYGATNFQITPAMPAGAVDDQGLIPHQLSLGAVSAGQPVNIALSYHREDTRTSTTALGLETPEPTRQPIASPTTATSPSVWPLIAAIVVGLALIVGGIVWYIRSLRADKFRPYEPPRYSRSKGRRSVRTSRAPRSRPRPVAVRLVENEPDEQVFCTQCGKQLNPDDTFCSRCGTRVKGK